MNFRLLAMAAPLALALSFEGAAHAKAKVEPTTEEVDPGCREARALMVTESKLAALAREAKEGDAPAPVVKQKAAKKSHPQRLHAKKLPKGHPKAQAKAKSDSTAPKVLGRRLTQEEVNGILATTRDFSGSDLSGLNLAGADLSRARFNRANLKSTNMERADLAETDLELADLSGANLRGASLNQARLRGTRMAGANMDGALWVDKTICKKGSLGNCVE